MSCVVVGDVSDGQAIDTICSWPVRGVAQASCSGSGCGPAAMLLLDKPACRQHHRPLCSNLLACMYTAPGVLLSQSVLKATSLSSFPVPRDHANECHRPPQCRDWPRVRK